MNLYSATIEILRRLTGHYALAPAIEKRTYVYILMPFDFRGNGHAKRAAVVEQLVENDPTTKEPIAVPVIDSVPVDGAGGEPDEPRLNYDLMWTLFLPNPLWPPKTRK